VSSFDDRSPSQQQGSRVARPGPSPSTKTPNPGLSAVLAWIALLWLIYGCDVLLTQELHPNYSSGPWTAGYLIVNLGITPLTLHGLFCIPTAPFLHANLKHLAANSLGLLILGWLSCRYSPRLTMVAVGESIVGGGLLAWALGDPGSCHIGASGVIFGLIGFLLGNALFRFEFLSLTIGIVTALLFAAVLPQALPEHVLGGVHHGAEQPVSWQMHLGGLIGGLSASWHSRAQSR